MPQENCFFARNQLRMSPRCSRIVRVNFLIGSNLLRMARAGQTFSPQQLLAMQIEVQRYREQVDLFVRVVDRATGTIKQVLGTQV